ncbi:MAG: sodium:calcium antiporter [Bacteroidota bacterium]|nr:sodium:calcium antiporter [Bacteroidota bacterium]
MHLQNLSLLLLAGIFIAGGIAIWFAGIQLSQATSKLSKHFELGSALGGMIILAIVTNLPEIAIVISASLQNKTEIAVGNILGGIGVQTVVLVVLDVFGTNKNTSLTYASASLARALEGLLVITVLTIVVLGHQLPSSLVFARVTPGGLLILAAWVIGLLLISKAGKGLPWKPKDNSSAESNDNDDKNDNAEKKNKQSTGKTMVIFLVAALATLVGGVALERSGDAISKDIGMQGILFGATIMAAATSLPEVSTGLASMKMKKPDMAVSDIFGGNAFLPVLFLFATIFSGKAVIPVAKNTDIYLTALAMLLTSVYIWGIIFRPKLKILSMGIDSFIVLVLYAAGVTGLFVI